MDQCLAGGRTIGFHLPPSARMVWLQPVFEGDRKVEDLIALVPESFALVCFPVSRWSDELSPWPAPPAFGGEPFGGKAEATLSYVRDALVPWVRARCVNLPLGLGGYSLAGLFSLWAATRTNLFSSIVAASPSVWYPGWMDYEESHPIQASSVYLSLGSKEAQSHGVGDCIRLLARRLAARGVSSILQWNPGGHFMPSAQRLAKGYRWALENYSS